MTKYYTLVVADLIHVEMLINGHWSETLAGYYKCTQCTAREAGTSNYTLAHSENLPGCKFLKSHNIN